MASFTGTFAGTMPTFTAAFVGTRTGPTGTNTTNAEDGRARGGGALVTTVVPVAAAPYPTDIPRVDKAIALPDPVLVKGRPT